METHPRDLSHLQIGKKAPNSTSKMKIKGKNKLEGTEMITTDYKDLTFACHTSHSFNEILKLVTLIGSLCHWTILKA